MSFLSRVRKSRLPHVLLVYVGASWVVIEAADLLHDALDLPDWVVPVTLILLLAGLVVVAATAWVQASPLTDSREAAGEVPSDWQLDLGDLGRSIRQGHLPHLTWGRAIMGGVVAFLALAGLVALVGGGGDGPGLLPGELAAESAAPGVAVLPFRVSGEHLDTWREGMVDLLSRNLDGLGGIRAIDSRTVLARWRETVAGEADLATAMEAARRTGARWAVMGSAVSVGSTVRVSADIHEIATGRRLEGASTEGPPDSLLSMVDALSVSVARALVEREHPDLSGLRLSSITTDSPEALRAYLAGEAAYRRSSFQAAIEAYERAVELDPGFALAHFRLGSARGWLALASAGEAREAAYEHRARLPAREALMVEAEYRARRGALPSGVALLREGVRRFPDDPELWYQLGDVLTHSRSQLQVGQEEAVRALEKATELDPSFGPYQIHLVDFALLSGDSAEAARRIARERSVAGESAREVQAHQLTFDYLYGDPESRDAVLERVDAADAAVRNWIRTLYTMEGERTGDALALALHVCEGDMASGAGAVPAAYQCVLRSFATGQIELARQSAALLSGGGDASSLMDFILRQTGIDPEAPLPRLPPATRLTLPSGAPLPDPAYFSLGVLAAEQRQTATVDSALAALDRSEAARMADGDTIGARIVRGLADGVAGYRALALEQDQDAAGKLASAEQLLAGSTGPESAFRTMVVWPLADLYAHSGQEREAIRLYESLWASVYAAPALLRRAAVHERLGERDRAETLRRRFLTFWRAAPADHPMIAEARRGLPPG